MNVATISRVNPAQASSKSCKASMVAKATPAKAFFGQAKALRAQSLSVRAKASKMVTKCAVRSQQTAQSRFECFPSFFVNESYCGGSSAAHCLFEGHFSGSRLFGFSCKMFICY